MAGSISLSLSQQFDSTGAPLNGGYLYTYAAGTTTPQSAYQDYSLTIPWPNPMVLDSAGRIPAFYLADGQIKIRLTDSAGVVQVQADNLLVVGASAGTGTPPTVDATTVLSTGDIKVRYGTGLHTGWVRSNGRTIGSASSGASERANSDCQTLFEYLWGADANLSVSTGRGGSANADWVANKTIALPDWRGRALAALDDMGNTAAGRLTATYFGTAATVLGAAGGLETSALTSQTNLPSANFAVSGGSVTVTTTQKVVNGPNSGSAAAGGTQVTAADPGSGGSLSLLTSTGTPTGQTAASGGSSAAFKSASPMLLATVYMKL